MPIEIPKRTRESPEPKPHCAQGTGNIPMGKPMLFDNVICPQCQNRFTFPPLPVGQLVKCPQCNCEVSIIDRAAQIAEAQRLMAQANLVNSVSNVFLWLGLAPIIIIGLLFFVFVIGGCPH